MENPNIYFPHLNLAFRIPSEAFNIFGVTVYWYGIILTLGMALGTLLSLCIAKKEEVSSEIVIDFVLYDLPFALLGARLYFVVFKWDYYREHISEIFIIRGGGIAIYGAIIASVLFAIIYTRYKGISFFKFADIATYGLVLGQAIGRYGNFFNKEAFGRYTDNLFAMAILKTEAKSPLTQGVLNHMVQFEAYGGAEYIQVHPTFFYESTWNLLLLLVLLFYRKHKKSNGEIFCLYLIGYGIGRFWIEGLRTDQLLLPVIGFPISQIVAICSLFLGIFGIKVCRKPI